MIFGKYITGSDKQAFIDRTVKVAGALGVPADWLFAVMYVESRFNHKVVNKTSRATGLIQFMPSTATDLGTSVSELANMSRIKQLDYVYKYYKPFIGKFKKFTDLYLATFFPAALTWSDSATLETSRLKASTVAAQNQIFDLDKNKKITVGEFRKAVLKYQPPEAAALETAAPWLLITALTAGIFFLFTRKKS